MKKYKIIQNDYLKIQYYDKNNKKYCEEVIDIDDMLKNFIKYQKAILKITEVLDTKSIFIRKKKIQRILEEYYYESN